jgi:putative ABC transport system permease protein
MILTRALVPVAIGLAVGLPAALVATRLAESALFLVTAGDPLTYVEGAGVILLVAAMAGAVPARAATRMNVISALREG